MGLIRNLKRLARDQRATSAMEFAFVAPALAFLAMGISDVARALARKYEIEQASYRALELVTAGSIQSDLTAGSVRSDYTYVRTEAAAATGEPESNVTVINWRECDGTKQTDFIGTCNSSQQLARFVQITIFSDFRPMFGYGPLGPSLGLNQNGVIRLTARSTLRVQ